MTSPYLDAAMSGVGPSSSLRTSARSGWSYSRRESVARSPLVAASTITFGITVIVNLQHHCQTAIRLYVSVCSARHSAPTFYKPGHIMSLTHLSLLQLGMQLVRALFIKAWKSAESLSHVVHFLIRQQHAFTYALIWVRAFLSQAFEDFSACVLLP